MASFSSVGSASFSSVADSWPSDPTCSRGGHGDCDRGRPPGVGYPDKAVMPLVSMARADPSPRSMAVGQRAKLLDRPTEPFHDWERRAGESLSRFARRTQHSGQTALRVLCPSRPETAFRRNRGSRSCPSADLTADAPTSVPGHTALSGDCRACEACPATGDGLWWACRPVEWPTGPLCLRTGRALRSGRCRAVVASALAKALNQSSSVGGHA